MSNAPTKAPDAATLSGLVGRSIVPPEDPESTLPEDPYRGVLRFIDAHMGTHWYWDVLADVVREDDGGLDRYHDGVGAAEDAFNRWLPAGFWAEWMPDIGFVLHRANLAGLGD